MHGRLARCLPYAVVGAAAGYLYYAAAHLEFHRRGANLGPDFWPKLVLALMIATCAFEILRILLYGGREIGGMLQDMVEASEHDHAAGAAEPAAQRHPGLLVAGIALSAFYVWVIQRLGFFLATAPYLVAFIALGGYRRWAVNLVVSVGGSLALMFFFMKLVYVSLPHGQGPFAEVTFWLMRVMGIH